MAIATLGFLKKLLDTPGPSGFELAPARVWRDEVKTFADDVRADVHGNSVAALNPRGKPRLMFAGHIDEIGIQITHIDEDGFFYFSGIGGWDSQVLVGQRVLILARGGPVHGVVGKKAVHQPRCSRTPVVIHFCQQYAPFFLHYPVVIWRRWSVRDRRHTLQLLWQIERWSSSAPLTIFSRFSGAIKIAALPQNPAGLWASQTPTVALASSSK